ncbi:STM3941 family protein [Mucilaginibacter gotjawali]|uniref:Uncharacterized protein n=2 Tax=Mucilaginibacter gotjawali TaxID=1550579 RepID=A0A0X8X434_9SPHI|nr:STM3941 family protein [Mucilaginibacter gotjawali]MBB3055941.1 hypothetical protein [Mucilaginibacter gotjawali]BAU54767.1 hypothetical protein MgSA37_02945 [Mucilaginibacter gotjawali]
MEAKTQFKFNPFFVILLSLLTFFFLYKSFANLPQPLVSWASFFICLPSLLIAYFILPMTFKMIFNIPSIILTDDCLNSNIGGYSIEWTDIASIELYNGGYRSFAKLAINLKDPDKYFNTPLKKFLYKTKQLVVVNDKSIFLDFVSGQNEEIFALIKAYWTKEVED